MTHLINLFAGPGAGKSTTAAGLFYEMKKMDMSVELAREYAKDVVWERRLHILEDQLYVLAKQAKRVRDLHGQVEWVITDSPLLLSTVYNKNEEIQHAIEAIVQYELSLYENHNYYIRRQKTFKQMGRVQSEARALRLDIEVLDILEQNVVPFEVVSGNEDAVTIILRHLGL